jgi:predicted transcriptional regulator
VVPSSVGNARDVVLIHVLVLEIDAALAAVLVQAMKDTVRGVAALIGASKSTVHNALGALIAAGVVERAGDGLVLR